MQAKPDSWNGRFAFLLVEDAVKQTRTATLLVSYVRKHLEEALLLIFIHPLPCIFYLGDDLDELTVLLPKKSIVTSFFFLANNNFDSYPTMVDVELAGIGEDVVENLLVDFDVQIDSSFLELGDGWWVSFYFWLYLEVDLLLLDVLLEQQSEFFDNRVEVNDAFFIQFLLALLEHRKVKHPFVHHQHQSRWILNNLQRLLALHRLSLL